MNAAGRAEFFKRVFLAVWAMATLVLVFFSALLLYELIEAGHNPLPLPELPTPSLAGQLPGERAPSREVTLYFADPLGAALAGETRELEIGAYTQDNCRKALEALIAGPQNGSTPILPASVKIRGAFLVENELVVDFSQELRTDPARPKSTSAEALMIHGIANTLTQSSLKGEDGAVVRRVRFLFEGSPLEESFPEHIDLSQPVEPDPRWFAARDERSGDGG